MLRQRTDWTEVGNILAIAAMVILICITVIVGIHTVFIQPLSKELGDLLWQISAVLCAVVTIGFHLNKFRLGAVLSFIGLCTVLFHIAVR